MKIHLPKGSRRVLDKGKGMAIRALQRAIVLQMGLVQWLEGGNSTVEPEARYDRPLDYDRYDRFQGSR